ncbi:T9SS type A sorting domain-containing protein [Psychroserpens sp. Hel_I_66]|uniref:T9SS type A sorting domain-containing protein n=1 Tax=Psychroserpens sp. Hel_I_66 TaxID=1250004 RepID=UPI0009DF5C6E|nr:T9SS type A sorting domain-containing protein [Psychroserpens sp. Hel_I_66]
MKQKILFPLIALLFSMSSFAQFVINEPSDYILCDDNNDGFALFFLNTKDAEILGSMPSNGFEVTYYMSQEDADNQINALSSSFTNTTNPQTVFANVVELSSGNLERTTFDLLVVATPQPNLLDVYEICDGSTLLVDSGLTDPSYSYSWYLDGIILEGEVNPLLEVSQTGNYLLQVFSGEDCTSFTEFEVIVSDFEDIETPSPLVVCDDNDDGFASFDLDSATVDILNGIDNASLIVTFYDTEADAFGQVDPLTSPYNNSVQYNQILYVRISNISGDCFTVLPIELIVQINCFGAQSTSIEICDNDPVFTGLFDLTSQNENIVNGEDVSNYNFSYHLTIGEADNDTNEITDITSYPHTVGVQILYVRVEEIVSGDYEIVQLSLIINEAPVIPEPQEYTICGGDEIVIDAGIFNSNLNFQWSTGETDPEIIVFESGTYSVTITDDATGCSSSVEIIVNQGETANINDPQDLVSCDTNGVFDLTSVIPDVLNGLDPNNYEITFYVNFSDVFNQVNAIASPNAYTAFLIPQTVYIRVGNLNDECFAFGAFDLISENCPIEVVCGEEPINTTYCYELESATQYTYTSSDGSPLQVVFNSGQVEDEWDELTVIDTDGTILYSGYGNSGDLTGLSFASSGDTITVFVDSDDVFACADQNYDPLDYDVTCLSDFGLIRINAFKDTNANSIFDFTEANFANGYFTYEVNNDGVVNTVNSSTGTFSILSEDPADTYDITFNLYEESANCFDITTSSFENVSVTTGNVVTLDFPVVEDNSCEDLGVYLVNYSVPPRPGFQHYNYLILENYGFTTIASGTVEFTVDPLLIFDNTFGVNSSYTINTTSNGFTVDFVNLEPGEVANIGITLTCPSSVELDDIVTNTATYLTDENDLVTSNNYSTLSEVVVGSWDPNDKRESHGPEVDYEAFSTSDEWLYYTIRFQNLGTFFAETVRIEDALDSQLDETTFQMLRSSHDNVVTLTDRDLEWSFENINLPAAQDDEEGSQGFVYFRIKPNPGYAIGDIIPNTASIFFDFNAPVITNTFTTEFVEENLSVNEAGFTSFNLYPNPAKDKVTIRLNTNNFGNLTVNITDLQGKLILEQQISEENNMELDIAALQSGLYFVKLNNNNKSFVKKLIIE